MLLKTITITAFKRPHYFEQLLLALVQNPLDGWQIHIQLEPSDKSEQFHTIAARILAGKKYLISVNDSIRGVRQNPYTLLDDVFSAGAAVNIYLEEDIVVAPDVTRLADWYLEHASENSICMNLILGGCFSAGFLSDENYPAMLAATKCFNSLGMILTQEQWQKHIKPNWLRFPAFFTSLTGHQTDGWDVAIYDYVLSRPELNVLSPMLARANHTGREDGIHCSEDFHDRAFANLPVYTGVPEISAYCICEDVAALPYASKAHLYLWQEMGQCLMTLKAQAKELQGALKIIKRGKMVTGWLLVEKILRRITG